MNHGKIFCVGLGPGDPDMMSVKADRLLRNARHVAYFRKRGHPGKARQLVNGLLHAEVTEYPMEYPLTTEFRTTTRAISPSCPASIRTGRPG
jgi:precorrin-2/cobalt-factor-2 C20-methyltransferase